MQRAFLRRSDWEVEIGFGKGRFLVGSAAAHGERPFLGLEIVSKYFRLAARRAAARGLSNLCLLRGEALYLIATLLPAGMAGAVHVYFPDPWPKSRHHRRRLLDPTTVDLVLSLLAPETGRLYFASDHQEYAEAVGMTLAGHPAVEVDEIAGPWPEGPRTNYEAKFEREGRPIVRLEARLVAGPGAAVSPGSALYRGAEYRGAEPAGTSAAAAFAGVDLLHPFGREAVLVGPTADRSDAAPAESSGSGRGAGQDDDSACRTSSKTASLQ